MNKKAALIISFLVLILYSLSAYALPTCTEIVKECRYNDEQSCRMSIAPCMWAYRTDMYGSDFCTPVYNCQSNILIGACGQMSFCAYGGNGYACWSCSGSNETCENQECLPRTPAPFCMPGAKRCAPSQDMNPSRAIIACGGERAPYSWQFLQDCTYGVCITAGINNPQCFECDQDRDGYWRQDQAPDGLNYCQTPSGGGDCAETAADCTKIALPSGQDYCKANLDKIHPQAKEICSNYVDDDCDGMMDFSDSDCKCGEPYTTGLQKDSCQDLDDFSNMNPSSLETELGTSCSAYKGGVSVSDTCYTGTQFDKMPETYKYIYTVWEADCGVSGPISNRRMCPGSQTVCFEDKCVESGKLYNWTEIKEGRPNVIFIPGQFGWYNSFKEFYDAYKDSYNLYYFAPFHLEDDGVNAGLLNNEIRSRISNGELKNQVYFITHSRGHFRLKMAVILSAELHDFYKKAVVFSISPPLGGSQFAFGGALQQAGSDILDGAHWIFPLGMAMSPAQYNQRYYAEKSELFLNSVKDYYTFIVRGDAHLAGVWDYMNPEKAKNEKDSRLKTWYENYIKTRGRHHYEYYLYPTYGFSDRHGNTADLIEVISNWDSESKSYISVYGSKYYSSDWIIDSSGLKGKRHVEHEFLLLYKPLIDKIKSVIDSAGAPLPTGMTIVDDASGKTAGNSSFGPCDVEKARLDFCIDVNECDVMCNATDNISECIDFCDNESKFCHDIFSAELDYCLKLQEQPANITEEREGGQVTPIVPVTEECKESWSCGSWQPCSESQSQRRFCEDLNKCGTEKSKPETERTCVYIPQKPQQEENVTVTTPEQTEQKPASWDFILPASIILVIVLAIIASYFTTKKPHRKRR